MILRKPVMNFPFENLEVWKQARVLVKEVYRITDGFPGEEKYSIVSQIRRSVISVSSNIAEGSTRWSRQDQARFYEIAFGSLMELLNQIILSKDLGFVEQKELDNIRISIESISRLLNALYKSTRKPS